MRSHFLLHNQQGFTLIESLITIVIVGIIAAIATPSFFTWLNNKKVDDVSAQIEGAIREAQSEATKKSISCALNLGTSITSTPSNCLSTGPRDLTKLGVSTLSSNHSGVSIGTANLGTSPNLQFSHKGTIAIGGTGTGIITVYQASGATGRNMRCIAIASGIGIIRTGKYVGATPNAPTDTNNCATNIP